MPTNRRPRRTTRQSAPEQDATNNVEETRAILADEPLPRSLADMLDTFDPMPSEASAPRFAYEPFNVPLNVRRPMTGRFVTLGYDEGERVIRRDTRDYDADGFDREGFNYDGFNREGWTRDGFDYAGYNAQGLNRLGFDREGYNAEGFDRNGWDRERYNYDGYDAQGYMRADYAVAGREGLNPAGYDHAGYNAQGFNRNGRDAQGFNRRGLDRYGFDREGYNAQGYSRDGEHRNGYDENGYDENGYNRSGYNVNGYDRDGYDRDGWNEDGYDRGGYNADGYDSDGYNRDGYDEDGENRDGDRDEERNGIRGYDHTHIAPVYATGERASRNAALYGIEIEVENITRREYGAWDDITDWKEDGSLNDGCEVATAPLSWDAWKERKGTWCDLLARLREQGGKAWGTGTCGLHVHMSRAGMSAADLYRLMSVVYGARKVTCCVAGREGNNYCSMDDADSTNRNYRALKAKQRGHSDNKYCAVRMTDETIEVRIFRGTLAEAGIWRALEFCHALRALAKCAPWGMRQPTNEDVYGYFSANRKAFPNVWARLETRYNVAENITRNSQEA